MKQTTNEVNGEVSGQDTQWEEKSSRSGFRKTMY